MRMLTDKNFRKIPIRPALVKGVNEGRRFPDTVNCSYLTEGNPCHSKVFVRKKEGTPIRAFVVKLMRTNTPEDCANEDAVVLPLLATKGNRKNDTHARAGLNWGQRAKRNQNEAYIPIPKSIRDLSFFPPRRKRFTALTDDGQSLILVVAQQYGKALHTTMDNSELGRYFRKRIGVPSGTFITRQHLLDYGRHDVGFYRIDSETYQMDFRPNIHPVETLERLES